ILEGGLPRLRISDASADEGSTMSFTVTLSEPATTQVTVDYATVQRPQGLGAATQGDDYGPCTDPDPSHTTKDLCEAGGWTWHPLSGTLTFHPGPPGDTSRTITVAIADDGEDEIDETFFVELSNPSSNASLGDRSGLGTINGTLDCFRLGDRNDPDLPVMTVQTPSTVDEGAGTMAVTVTVSRPICQGTAVAMSASQSSADTAATLGDDYRLPLALPALAPLATTTSLNLEIIDDDIVEHPETIGRIDLSFSLEYGTTQVTSHVPATATITDNDQATVSAGGSSADAGDTLIFTAVLDRVAPWDVTIDYATADGTALAGQDYRTVSGTATIASGQRSVDIRVPTIQDFIEEPDETFRLELSNPSGGQLDGGATEIAVTGTIRDDDDLPALSISNAAAYEGETLTFAVTLGTPSGRAIDVAWSTEDRTATAGSDYTAVSGTVTIAAGSTSAQVQVVTLTDNVPESAERLAVILSPTPLALLDDGEGTGVIFDVGERELTVSDATTTEGGTLRFEVGFDGPAFTGGTEITVDYRTAAGTAAAGDDYSSAFESTAGTLRIVSGQTSATASVPTVQDSLDEDAEQMELVLSDPVGGVLAVDRARGVIIDDDPLPALSVSNAEATEGDDTHITFTVSLSEASGRAVSVRYSTADMTATAGSDYTAVTSPLPTLTFTAGEQSKTVSVALSDDTVAEDLERFQLVLSSPANATLADPVGVGTILDDDGLVQILAEDAPAVYEGDGVSAVFTVRLSRAATAAVTVQYSTSNGTAESPGDYTAASSQTLTFAPGDTTMTVSVALANDDIPEDTETFGLVLSTPSSNAEIGEGTAVATILDDDNLPTLSVGDATAAEGASASFTVRLSASSSRAVTVDYATIIDPTAGDAAAVPAQDFSPVSGTLTIAARSDSATITVALPDDSLDEHTETFWLRLTNPTGTTILDGTGVGAITDDDPLPQLSIANGRADEGDAVVLIAHLAPVSGRTVTVPWTTAATTSGNPATAGEDYTAASGTLTFASGASSARIEVATLQDTTSETDEPFQVQQVQPTHATLDDAIAMGVIHDDDGLPRVSVADTEVSEDASPATFTVTLSHASSQAVSVDYATSDESPAEGAATAGDDYATSSGAQGTLTIPAGRLSGGISVFIANDDDAEETETFTLTLSNPTNAVIAEGGGTATGTILDDEGLPRLSVSDAHECEDGSSEADCAVRLCRAGGFRTIEEYTACQTALADPDACQEGMCGGDGVLEFAVELSHASTEETSVRYSTFAASAAHPRDYIATAGTLTIPAGDTTASIPVTLVDDGVHEQLTETFLLVLSDANGVELETEQATGTIRDDDRPPLLSSVHFGTFANEDDGFAYHEVTLSHPSDLEVSAFYNFREWTRSGGRAVIDDTDENGKSCSQGHADQGRCKITFAPGVVEQTIEVPLLNNHHRVTPNYSYVAYLSTEYHLTLSSLHNARHFHTSARGRVWDDEHPPYVDSVAVLDTLEGAGEAVFTITLNRFSDTEVIATYKTVDGSATAGTDYTAKQATVTFPPGTITATATVEILNDNMDEGEERFTLEIIDDPGNSNLTYLSSPLWAGAGDRRASVLIIDDDTLPWVAVAYDVSANENAGTVTFWVGLSRASASDVTVDYATADVSATAGQDYIAPGSCTDGTSQDEATCQANSETWTPGGTLTIPAGALGAPVTVTIIDDTDNTESDETFHLNLSNPVNAQIAQPAGAAATIIEDANLPTITISDYAAAEMREAATRSVIRFGFERLATQYQVDWRVEEVPSLGDQAATIGTDFLAPLTSGRVTVIPIPGRGAESVEFDTVWDNIPERDERFRIVLSNPVGVLLGNRVAWGTIVDDDVPIVTVLDVEASEADAAVVFHIQLFFFFV
ncbi:MAG: hypothetical protein F4Y13_09950, partial [Acidimicrobiaceae bacterium]|nr:hypothetical protein [Acidimicrobiaceae bacterium]